MKREPIVFVLVLAILGLMGYQLTSNKVPAPARSGKSKQIEPYALPDADGVAQLNGNGPRRDLFLRPSADTPLPPLQLPAPPLAAFPELMPPPLPLGRFDGWCQHLMVLEPGLAGSLDDLFVAGDTIAGSLDAGGEGLSSSPDLDNAFADQDAAYRQSYDWIRLSPVSTVYGHIMNEDRYELAQGDDLIFVTVNPATGRESVVDQLFTKDNYEAFGFAETLRNEIELLIRKERGTMTAGRLDSIRETISWFLNQGLQEPVAFEYAEEMARKAVELAPDDINSWLSLGEVWERTFAFDRAFAMYAQLAGESLPQVPSALDVPVPQGRFDYAAAPRVHMASILQRLGLEKEAREQLEVALNLADGDPSAPLALGQMYLADGRLEEGQGLIERALTLQPRRNSPAALANGLAVGEAALARGQWDAAIAAYEETLRAANDDAQASIAASSGHAAALYLSGRFADAQEIANAAIQQYGSHPHLLYMRGVAEAADGGSAGNVIRDLRAAAVAAPFDAAPAFAAQAFWLDRLGEEEAAAEALDQALSLDPSLVYGRYLRAVWDAEAGGQQAAADLLLDLARHAAPNAAVLSSFGTLLYNDGSFTQASVAFSRSEEEFPQGYALLPNQDAWGQLTLRRALNHLALGEVEDTIAACEAALSLDENLLAARNLKAAALYASGDLDAATADFSYVLDLLREEEEHPQRLYAENWQARVMEHDRLRRWTDDFDGRRLAAGWDTQAGARLGVEPRLEDGALTIRGKHDGGGETRTYRTMPGIAFRQFAGTLAVGRGHQGEAGLFLALMNRSRELWSFRVYRDREGVVAWATTQGSRSEQGRTAFRIAEGGSARVQFSLNRETSVPVLTVTIEGQVVWSEEVSNLRNPTGSMAVGLSATTAHSLDVDVALDDVALIYAQP